MRRINRPHPPRNSAEKFVLLRWKEPSYLENNLFVTVLLPLPFINPFPGTEISLQDACIFAKWDAFFLDVSQTAVTAVRPTVIGL